MTPGVLLRLGVPLLKRVEAYARSRRISRERALIELIERGLDGEEPAAAVPPPKGPPPLSTQARLRALFDEPGPDPSSALGRFIGLPRPRRGRR